MFRENAAKHEAMEKTLQREKERLKELMPHEREQRQKDLEEIEQVNQKVKREDYMALYNSNPITTR